MADYIATREYIVPQIAKFGSKGDVVNATPNGKFMTVKFGEDEINIRRYQFDAYFRELGGERG